MKNKGGQSMKFKRVILPTTITVPDANYCFDPEGQCPHFRGYGNGIYCSVDLGLLAWKNNTVEKPNKCQELIPYDQNPTNS